MVKCKKCGCEMPRTNKFCGNCGARNTHGLGCVIIVLAGIILFIFAIFGIINSENELIKSSPASEITKEDALIAMAKGDLELLSGFESRRTVVQWPIVISKISLIDSEIIETDDHSYAITVNTHMSYPSKELRRVKRTHEKGDTVIVKGVLSHFYMDSVQTLVIDSAYVVQE